MEKAARFPDVMLLAAGLGTRLRPITETIPKPLVPVAGMPLIERIMVNARAEGVTRFVANAHYRADQLLAHFGGLLKVNREAELLGTGGGVKAGTVYGTTDELGLNAVENRVHVHDLHATILHLLGFDHRQLTFFHNGRDERLTDNAGKVVKGILA